MRSSRDEASTSTELMSTLSRGRAEPVLDLVAAVNALHELSAQQLNHLPLPVHETFFCPCSPVMDRLNSRKAKLARAAKDVRAPCEGENLDKQGGSGITLKLNSPHSPMDSSFVPSASRGDFGNEVDCTPRVSIDENFGTSLAAARDAILPSTPLELGQYVTIMGEKAEEIGKGKVFQIGGKWFGRNLEESGVCVIGIVELTVDRCSKILHPMEITGTTFDQAEKRLGSMRVLWDFKKLFPLPTR